tara:strand:- start:633 stop:1427 length:795 start_codon:yes stop_codon:yes gene_type:complete
MKLNKKTIRRIILEEVELFENRRLWEIRRKRLSKIRENLIKSGYDKNRVDENLASTGMGLVNRVLGLGGSEFVSPDSESLFGGLTKGVRTAFEQTAIESVVKAAGLDPYTGMGLVLKNTIEEVLKTLIDDGRDPFKELLSDDCRKTAFEISKKVLAILEESMKERVLKFALDAIAGEFGTTIQTNPLFKPAYQGFRESFSESFSEVMREDEIADSLSELICKTFSLDNILGHAGSFAGDAGEFVSSKFGDIASAFDGIDLGFGS